MGLAYSSEDNPSSSRHAGRRGSGEVPESFTYEPKAQGGESDTGPGLISETSKLVSSDTLSLTRLYFPIVSVPMNLWDYFP